LYIHPGRFLWISPDRSSLLDDELLQMIANAQIFSSLFLLCHCLEFSRSTSTTIHEVNEAIFLDPRTHSALIRCPLDFTPSADIQWYDVANHRYETEHGRFYRVNGSQPFDREFICSPVSPTGTGGDDKYRIKIRTYGKAMWHSRRLRNARISLERPLNIRNAILRNVTNTSITIDWEDDNYNRNANVTYYELVLK
jgi:hypothetical protein